MAATTSPEVVEWAPPVWSGTAKYLLRDCGFAGAPPPGNGGLESTPPSTQRHRALCRTSQLYHVPHWCSVLAETDARTRRLQEVRQRYSYAVRQGARGVDTKAVLVVRCLAPLPLSSFPHALLPCWSRGDLSVSGLQGQ